MYSNEGWLFIISKNFCLREGAFLPLDPQTDFSLYCQLVAVDNVLDLKQ